ncbi:6-hydroxymethylpterin diphosphokinase MptE-like protein [Halococcus agarilyticus]|uniref:6-hydroxymethylpterin diphosphokinase MptE-like protein n=1 Tax=Halococcus agarilyticus TaxID=1232219 RepID=UPI000678184F|nr:6-hydroxymethylpterin diphosphokinase MptE-like protein [Halococcus agarilyticus]
MQFEAWEPVYEAILTDFGFDRAADDRVRDILAGFAEPFDLARLDISGESVVIVGAGPSLETDLDSLSDELLSDGPVFAASTAADRLREAGIEVDCMVTDLDKNPDTVRDLTARGTPVAVHAHGDNEPLVRDVVPTLDAANVLATTQAAPVGSVRNFGGFTDGDRTAFLADHCGARRLQFVGWDFDDDSVGSMKRQKLAWAERLLYWLERRRNERFSVLDGRRDAIDTAPLPVE